MIGGSADQDGIDYESLVKQFKQRGQAVPEKWLAKVNAETPLLECNVDPIRVLMQCRFTSRDTANKRIWFGLDVEWLKLALIACKLEWTDTLSAQVRLAEAAMLKWLNR